MSVAFSLECATCHMSNKLISSSSRDNTSARGSIKVELTRVKATLEDLSIVKTLISRALSALELVARAPIRLESTHLSPLTSTGSARPWELRLFRLDKNFVPKDSKEWFPIFDIFKKINKKITKKFLKPKSRPFLL